MENVLYYYLNEHQVTYQGRILTTALFARILLNKVLPIKRWLSLLLLMSGVVLTQVHAKRTTKPINCDYWLYYYYYCIIYTIHAIYHQHSIIICSGSLS